jgi:hypothetical protein
MLHNLRLSDLVIAVVNHLNWLSLLVNLYLVVSNVRINRAGVLLVRWLVHLHLNHLEGIRRPFLVLCALYVVWLHYNVAGSLNGDMALATLQYNWPRLWDRVSIQDVLVLLVFRRVHRVPTSILLLLTRLVVLLLDLWMSG